MIVKRGVGRNEFLEVRHSPEPRHRSLSSSEGQVAVLGPVVEMATDVLAVFVSDLFHGGAIRSKSIGGDEPRCSIPFHGFLQKCKCRLLIPGFGDVAFQHFTFVIDGAPEVMLDAVDFHEDFIEMPVPLSMLTHVGCTLGSDLAGEDRTKTIDPKPDAFMADIDSTLMKQVFDVAQ